MQGYSPCNNGADLDNSIEATIQRKPEAYNLVIIDEVYLRASAIIWDSRLEPYETESDMHFSLLCRVLGFGLFTPNWSISAKLVHRGLPCREHEHAV